MSDSPYKMKGSSLYGHGSSSPAKLTDAEKAANLAKHAEKGKDDPNYWKAAKKVTGSDKITYKGETH